MLIDKPEGWTSHDVVAKLRGVLSTRRIGHAGTLDPMATGLLVLGVDAATKLLTFLVGCDKTYEATIRLGASTITDDRESEYVSVAESGQVQSITPEQIAAAIASLTGDIQQVPSSVSAIKVNGVRAYTKAREGEEVKLDARPVKVSKFEMLSVPRMVEADEHTFLDLDVVVDCSSGTYIRALARDLGGALGVGGHLTALRRTRVGSYVVAGANELEGITKDKAHKISMFEAVRDQFAIRLLSEQDEIDLRQGKRLALSELAFADRGVEAIAGVTADHRVVAMLTKSGNQLKSLVVFANS